MNILIVDDSRTVHGVLTRTLEMSGVVYGEVFHAYNGEEGLTLLEENDVDIIFSDIHMPVMDGIEMIEHIKSDENLCTLPIIIVSTEGSRVRIEHLQEKGIAAFLRKPFTPEQIKKILEDVMGAQDGCGTEETD
jgi:two-component system chemotaxis response regulator CheY